MLALSKQDIKQLVPIDKAVELMKLAFQELSAGRAKAPVRTVLEVNDDPSSMLMMPGFVPAEGALGFKVVTFFGGNQSRELPVIHALVCLFDHEKGVPLGILEGGWVTALRTGAVSGAATDLLARNDASVLAVIGTGVQGVTQAAAVCAVRPIEKIIGADLSTDQLDRFRKSLEADWPELAERLETTTDANAAVHAADIVCTSTTSRTAVFSDNAVRRGTHINAIGAFTPEMQEIPVETVSRANVFVDNFDAVMAEAGDLLKAIEAGAATEDDFHRELGMIVSGELVGRQNEDEITLFKSVGNSVQDVVVARYAIDAARQQHVGTEIDFG